MTESLLIIVTLFLMTLSLLLILIPAVPVSALEWGIAMVFGALTGFSRLTPYAAIIATILMLVGSTAGLWMPFFGLRGKQLSCLGLLAFFIGMIAGSALIPLPFIGTIIGGVLGVMLVEFLRLKEINESLRSGGAALRLIIYGMIAEFFFSTALVGTVMLSILLTA